MLLGIVALARLQAVTLAAAVAFSFLHRTFTVKLREAVAFCNGGKSMSVRGCWLWRVAAVLSWLIGYALAFVGPTALYILTYTLACSTLGSKYYVMRCNLRQAFGERRVRMLALHCPNVLAATDI